MHWVLIHLPAKKFLIPRA